MKIVSKPIEVVCWFEENGSPHPVRFRIKNDDDTRATIKINKIMFTDKEKFAGNPVLVFNCLSLINDSERFLELKYEINTCRWYLYKI